MAYISGTATNHQDLFDKTLNFIKSNGWSELARDASITGHEKREYVALKGQGLSGKESIYVYLGLTQNTVTDTYSLRIHGSSGYLPDISPVDFDKQPGNSYQRLKRTFRSPIHGNSMNYWLVANPQRFIVVANFNGRWSVLHAGFILAYDKTDAYPYPLWVAANNSSTDSYKDSGRGAPWCASEISGALYLPGGYWGPTPDYGSSTHAGCNIWPHSGLGYSVVSTKRIYAIKDRHGVPQYQLLPMVMYNQDTSSSNIISGIMGQPQGLFYISGWDLSAGDIIKCNDVEHLVIAREQSTDAGHFAALALE